MDNLLHFIINGDRSTYIFFEHYVINQINLKGNATQAVNMYWSKVLSRPFILMRGFSKSAQK